MKIYDMDKKCFVEIQKYDNPSRKVEQLSDALYRFENNMFDIIYDKSQPSLVEYINSLDADMLTQDGMQFLYFTSGTTGTPTGVYKTKQNSLLQAQALIKTFKGQKFDRVVTTVPFVHIYGVDIGGVVPLELDIDVWTKENFLPQELAVEAQKPNTLIVTTPVFIKALNRVKKDAKFTSSLFLTSTAPLPLEDAKEFREHYGCSVMQLFASTETGLMAYKVDDEQILKAYDGIHIGEDSGMLNISSPLVTQRVISDGKLKDVVQPFQTEDIVEIVDEHSFKLLGRSSNLAKIAGKRVSTQQIENLIELVDGIDAVLIKIRKDERALKDEILEIYVEGQKELKPKELKAILKENFGSIHIPFKIHNNMKILRSSVGKKIGFE
ncbi:MAG: acyl--CoA ligase [Epsilonproteobacteria bacterium]|nr:acyl--CoA ligase [Campylobacterota bacterium]